ncbi:imidazole glycerol phosphate synthase cyclase subunit [Terrimonas sp. NA20]|uniref:imidazole glycerol-phosphate synthase n=1 Tax=Terrimonas ginsenosidimutans TaxID=2908004 RepID=A0ABS9KUW9_9BACT|nr:imidazole glycerol phosphate synthase cyclase subunit [Terrimonas ginsenosidimutans]MCG2616075.1 imidazole glycerol phosphate synthase cyclase subunit [Terrimonas ginsenosidimutans]
MLKTRLIPVLYIKNGLIVRSEGFEYHQNIGNIINQASRYNEWDVDELIYIDISHQKEYDLRRDDHKIKSYSSIEEIIKQISKICFMPLTFGGGIRTIEDIDLRIQNGADKISINTEALLNIDIVKKASLKYGNQCVVISVDYRIIDNEPVVFSHYGQKNTGINLLTWIRRCEEAGAGEIFINAIDRDGMANGYDTETIKKVAKETSLPIIACGGAGDPYDFVDLASEVKISGIAAGNIFHFTERSYPRAKQLLKKSNINVR